VPCSAQSFWQNKIFIKNKDFVIREVSFKLFLSKIIYIKVLKAQV